MNFRSNVVDENNESSNFSELIKAHRFMLDTANNEKWDSAKLFLHINALADRMNTYKKRVQGNEFFFKGYLSVRECLIKKGDIYIWEWPTVLPTSIKTGLHEGHKHAICLGIRNMLNHNDDRMLFIPFNGVRAEIEASIYNQIDIGMWKNVS